MLNFIVNNMAAWIQQNAVEQKMHGILASWSHFLFMSIHSWQSQHNMAELLDQQSKRSLLIVAERSFV